MPQVFQYPEPNHRLMPVWMRPLLPKRFVAITLSKTLIYYRTSEHLENQKLRAHETCHAKQYARMGWFKFIITYLYYTCRYGYKANPLEIEARKYAGDSG